MYYVKCRFYMENIVFRIPIQALRREFIAFIHWYIPYNIHGVDVLSFKRFYLFELSKNKMKITADSLHFPHYDAVTYQFYVNKNVNITHFILIGIHQLMSSNSLIANYSV